MKIRRYQPLWIFLMWLCFTTTAFGQTDSDNTVRSETDTNRGKVIKTLIIYQSKYGSTEQYARWIWQDLQADLIDIAKVTKADFAGYDLIVFGGYLRTGKMSIAPFINDHWNAIKTRQIVLFTTSGTPPRHPKIQEVYEKSLPGNIRKAIMYFPLRGRISMKDLTFFDRQLMSVGKMMEADENLKRDMGQDFDGVQHENLHPLIEYLKNKKVPARADQD